VVKRCEHEQHADRQEAAEARALERTAVGAPQCSVAQAAIEGQPECQRRERCEDPRVDRVPLPTNVLEGCVRRHRDGRRRCDVHPAKAPTIVEVRAVENVLACEQI
jgi:hypothetical protein